MIWLIGLIVAVIVWRYLADRSVVPVSAPDLSMLPERFVVFDLETTGLDPDRHEIIEIGAIRVNRDAVDHETFQTLVSPTNRVPKKIIELTGITNEMLKADGVPLAEAITEFRQFVGDLPLVAFNADFDDAFLRSARDTLAADRLSNESCCALRLARRAWPDRKSFRLADLSRDGGLSMDDNHRALGDCRRTMIVYISAAQAVGSHR